MTNNLTNYKKNLKDHLGILYEKFSAAPIGLKAFAIFALIVTVLELSIYLLAKQDIRSFYSEKFGVNTGSSYMFTLLFTGFLIFSTKGSKPFGLRFAIAALLILKISFQCLKLLSIIDDGGKFEKSGTAGLIWSIIIPAIWVIVIFSPGVSKFCNNILLRKKLISQL